MAAMRKLVLTWRPSRVIIASRSGIRPIGLFDNQENIMPRRNSNARVEPALHKNTAGKIRAKYREIWSQEWPHNDRYLNQLWFTTADETDRLDNRYAIVLNAMRECDETIPAAYGRVVQQG